MSEPVELKSIDNPELVALLRDGAVGVLPTDTVYGLVASAADESAVAKLYELKSREQKPGTIIAASIDDIATLGVKLRYLKAVEQYWPGAISVVVPVGEDVAYLHLGKRSLAVRIPSDSGLQHLLQQTGPLVTSSANHSGEPPANTLAEARRYFGKAVDFYVDGGDLSGRHPSTIIRVVDDAIEVLREGAVKINESGRIE